MRSQRAAILLVAPLVAMTGLQAWSKPRLEEALPPARTICVTVGRLGPYRREPFMRGFMRAVQQRELPVEQSTGNGRWRDVGEIPNLFRLSAASCLDEHTADSLELAVATPDSAAGVPQVADSLVRVELGGYEKIITDYFYDPQFPLAREDPHRDENNLVMQIRVAVCGPESLASEPVWTTSSVQWTERPETPARGQEIQGWMAGMLVLQQLYRRAGWLAEDCDLVFESRGRNR